MNEIYIHIGLHKTGSTFLQKVFCPLYTDQCNYISLRKNMRDFLNYILDCNDLNFSEKKSRELFCKAYENIPMAGIDKLTFSDEQFCGSPWNNAKDRKRYFDRLCSVFPNAKFILVLRKQEDITESLYLQYIKTGGEANWDQFISHKTHPLEFARKTYLDYGKYVQYIISRIGKNRLLILFYEDLVNNPDFFLAELASFIGIKPKKNTEDIAACYQNKPLPPLTANLFVYVNRFFSSSKHPFGIFPSKARKFLIKTIIAWTTGKRRRFVDKKELHEFCRETKKNNAILAKISGRDISKLGY